MRSSWISGLPTSGTIFSGLGNSFKILIIKDVSIVKLKQIHEMTHPTLHHKPSNDVVLEATEEELLSTLDEEEMEDNEV